jgi:hypothetical protein
MLVLHLRATHGFDAVHVHSAGLPGGAGQDRQGERGEQCGTETPQKIADSGRGASPPGPPKR